MKNKAIILAYFASHATSVKELHFTADEQCFLLEHDAKNHAEKLKDSLYKDGNVYTYTKAEAEALEGDVPAEKKAYKDMKKDELIDELTKRSIEYAKGAKNADLIEALEADDARKAINSKYRSLDREALEQELTARAIAFEENADEATLIELLEASDKGTAGE